MMIQGYPVNLMEWATYVLRAREREKVRVRESVYVCHRVYSQSARWGGGECAGNVRVVCAGSVRVVCG
jgi:hypothetical protein